MYLYINPQDKTVPFGITSTPVMKKRGRIVAEFNLTGRLMEWTDPHDFGNKVDLFQPIDVKHCVRIEQDLLQNDSVYEYAQVRVNRHDNRVKKLAKMMRDAIGTVQSIHDGIAYSWFDGHGVLPLPVGILECFEYQPQSNIDLGL